MIDAGDEARVLRRRMDALEAAIEAMARRGDCGSAAIVVKVQGAGGASEFLSVKAVTLDGVEAEGEAVTLAVAGEAFPAANVGTGDPDGTEYLVADLVDGLWTVQFDGGGTP